MADGTKNVLQLLYTIAPETIIPHSVAEYPPPPQPPLPPLFTDTKKNVKRKNAKINLQSPTM